MRNPRTLVEAQDVVFWQDGLAIVSEINLLVQEKEVLGIVGENGAGKTTLLRLLLGLEKPTSGSLRKRKGLKAAYCPQGFSKTPWLPISSGRFLGLLAPLHAPWTKEVLERLDIAHLLERPLEALSGGEHQRVLLARALLRQPHFLVADEPASHQDPLHQERAFAAIAHARDVWGTGAVVVAHQVKSLAAFADRMILLESGRMRPPPFAAKGEAPPCLSP